MYSTLTVLLEERSVLYVMLLYVSVLRVQIGSVHALTFLLHLKELRPPTTSKGLAPHM